MGAVGVGVHPGLAALLHRVRDLVADADAAEGEVARRDGLGELDHVGLDAPVLQAEHPAGAAEPGDDLVRDQQHVVPGADLADAREVVGLGRDHAAAALHRLGDEHGDRLRPFGEDGLLQLVRRGDALAFRTLRRLVAVGIGAWNVDEARHARLEHRPVDAHPRRAHGGERDAVIAPDAGDHLGLLRPPFSFQ